MKPQAAQPDIIDLTRPDIVELDSDGELINEDVGNGIAVGASQSRNKRRKRKKRPAGSNATVPNEAGASRAHTPTDSNDKADGWSGAAGERKSLADRLTGPSYDDEERVAKRRDEKRERERRRDQQRAGQRESDRYRERDRERERGGDRRREREWRRSISPRHDRDRESVRDPDRSRRRSRSPERERERRKGGDKPPEDNIPFFFEDVQPAETVPVVNLLESVAGPSTQSVQASTSPPVDGLLLPAHVLVAEEAAGIDGPLQVPTPEGSDDGDDDYIEYLDYDDGRRAPGMVRYWELEKLEAEEARAAKPARFVCKKCGAEGEHKTYECPVLICLTCGARDEHSTRSCPISKVCFTCGMKGHINKTCPNRGKHGAYHSSHECERCGARTHQTNECPTLWRIYKYVEDDVRQETLRVRQGKRMLAFGQGGEGYIATDEWCYNCGGSGHFGDDCTALPHSSDFPSEHSAFSLYNILSGPFSSEAAQPSKRPPRDWETASAFADGYGFNAPMEVGRQGRRKERERQARALENAEDDPEDWFGAARSRGRAGDKDKDRRSPGRGGGGSKVNGSGKHLKFYVPSLGGDGDAKRQRSSYDDMPRPSRETDSINIRGAAQKHSHSSTSSRNRSDRYDRDCDRDHDRECESQRGPRYRGGYSR